MTSPSTMDVELTSWTSVTTLLATLSQTPKPTALLAFFQLNAK